MRSQCGVLDVTATASYTMAGANTYTFGINSAGTGSARRIDAGALDGGFVPRDWDLSFLFKPFGRFQLARKVREVREGE